MTMAPETTLTVAHVLDARPRDIGGFAVRRVLPAAACRSVGPFVFLDHMGPADLAPGHGMDVPPHPHIGLATVTYLLEGEIVHRDSVGAEQTIRPGDINWMTAGSGIVHSERTAPEVRRIGSRVHGLQIWVALPAAEEEHTPKFDHYPASALPAVKVGEATVRVLAGSAYGATSPVRTLSPLFYVEAVLPAGAALAAPPEHEERAVYVVLGAIDCEGARAEAGRMFVLTPGAAATLRATEETRIVILGGPPLDGPRHIWWNFVSSSKARIEEAKVAWKDRRFPPVPGDATEFVPLPE
jgi:redox-sensitive bicupin YhaK (pirin superfamily)